MKILTALALVLCAGSSCTRSFPVGGWMEDDALVVAAVSAAMNTRTDWLAFDPKSVSGLRLWLKAESIALGNGASVTTWADLSGTGNTVTAGTAPTYYSSANTINGRPVVRFVAASSHFLSNAAPTGLASSDSVSFFLVMRPTTSANYEVFAVGNCGSSGRQLSYSNGTQFIENKYCTGPVASPTVTWPAGTAGQLTILQNLSSSIVFKLNGATVASLVPAASGLGSGALTIGGVTPSLNADIAEILFYDNRITDSNAARVECYLGARYGTNTTSSCP